VRPGTTLPARSVVGLFSGRIFSRFFCGSECRSDSLLSLPSLCVNRAHLKLCVDATAQSARFPSPLQAALYQHSCEGGPVVGEWVAAAPIPTFEYLIARTVHTLYQGDDLRLGWALNQHALDGSYSLSQPEALLWRRSGLLTRRCP
jgi:hypothetical protein